MTSHVGYARKYMGIYRALLQKSIPFIGLFCKRAFHVAHRPTQSIIWVPLQVNRFQKIIVLIVQYKYSKSCSGDLILQNLILRTRSCGTGFITQHSCLLHCRKFIVPQLYQQRRGISEGPALKYFYMIHRGGRFV